MKKWILLPVAAVFCASAGYAVTLAPFDHWPFSAPVVEAETSVVAPSQGNIIFDYTSTTDGDFKGYNGSSWVNLGAGSGNSVPPGLILPFAGTSAPAGYLVADGSSVSRTTYAALFAAIGTAYGAGDGSTTFNLPDLRGRFLRGVDGVAGRDPDAAGRTAMNTGGNTGNAVGSVQGHAFSSHSHVTAVRNASADRGLAGATSFASATTAAGGYGQTNAADYAGPSSNATGGNETRPVNAYVNYLIKY